MEFINSQYLKSGKQFNKNKWATQSQAQSRIGKYTKLENFYNRGLCTSLTTPPAPTTRDPPMPLMHTNSKFDYTGEIEVTDLWEIIADCEKCKQEFYRRRIAKKTKTFFMVIGPGCLKIISIMKF